MSSHINTLFIISAEKKAAELIAGTDNTFKKCDRKVKMIEQQLEKADAVQKKTEAELTDVQAQALFPKMFESAKQLPLVTLQLAVSKYNHANDIKEKESYQSRYRELLQQHTQTKKEKKELEKTFDELTANISLGKKLHDHQSAIEELMKEVAMLKAMLKARAEENVSKDKQIHDMKAQLEDYKQSESENARQLHELQGQLTDLKQEVQTYQKESAEGYAKQCAASEAYAAELQRAFESTISTIEGIHAMTVAKLEEDHKAKVDEVTKKLAAMTAYAEDAVAMLNHAWYYGAKTMAVLRRKLAQVGFKEWCGGVSSGEETGGESSAE
ncbi:hypothetical protein J1614_000219 [Plenodomus biglobosus]|nr:hypothetical protein J1614_000219 [Plenodomus biglobosus]